MPASTTSHTSDDGFIWYKVREVKLAQRKPFDVADRRRGLTNSSGARS